MLNTLLSVTTVLLAAAQSHVPAPAMNDQVLRTIHATCTRITRVETDQPNVILRGARVKAGILYLDLRVTGFFPVGTTRVGISRVEITRTGYLFLSVDDGPEIDVLTFEAGLGPNDFAIRGITATKHRVLYGLRNSSGSVVAFGQICI